MPNKHATNQSVRLFEMQHIYKIHFNCVTIRTYRLHEMETRLVERLTQLYLIFDVASFKEYQITGNQYIGKKDNSFKNCYIFSLLGRLFPLLIRHLRGLICTGGNSEKKERNFDSLVKVSSRLKERICSLDSRVFPVGVKPRFAGPWCIGKQTEGYKSCLLV